MGLYGLNASGSVQGPVECSCEHGNEPSCSIRCWEILEQLSDWRLFKKNSAPWSYLLLEENKKITAKIVSFYARQERDTDNML
jgi:hypothetical protein